MAAGLGYDDRDPLLGSLKPHHLRIGDAQFFVPPTAITVTRRMKNETINMIRSRGSFIKNSGYFDLIIDIDLFFPDKQSINNELRPLLAQVKKCPFLPIENAHLNEVYDIQAVTIAGITVSSVEGFPNSLIASLQLYAFNPNVYIFNENDKSFDEMFNWPLFRWYYRRNLQPSNGRFTYFEPMLQELGSEFTFRTAFEGDLQALREWRIQRDKIIRDWTKDKANKSGFDIVYELFNGTPSLLPDEIDEDLFNAKIDEHYKKAIFEYDITMEDWIFDDLVLEDISVSFQNVITSFQLQEHESPAHQYLGSQDTIITCRFRTHDRETLANFEGMIRRANYLVREYHKEISNGFLEFDHPLLRLFGVKYVVVDDVESKTVEGLPGVFDITLSLIAYNRAQKKFTETKLLSGEAAWDINEYQDASLLVAQPIQWLLDRPIIKEALNLYEQDVKKKVLYEAKVKEAFKAIELYPDLELPTYAEVEAAGFKIPNNNDGLYVDPDFFLIYEDVVTVGDDLQEYLNEGFKGYVRDTIGGEAIVDKGEMIPTDSTEEYIRQQKAAKKSALKPGITQEPPEETHEENLPAADMEALIRQITLDISERNADEEVIKQGWAVAFAKSFDEQLRQFYSVGYEQNKELGNVVVQKSNVPVMQTADMRYFMDTDFIREAAHIGVMRVSPLMGDPNSLGSNYEYNIEMGVQYLQYYYKKVKSNNLISQYVYDAFGLDSDLASNAEKCYFAAAVCMYLGFENEYNKLQRSNKKMSYVLIMQIKKMLEIMDEVEEEWSKDRIKKRVASLPVPDYKTISMNNTSDYLKSDPIHEESDFEDPETTLKEMFHDMIKYDRRGRLVRAFPTFFMMFIDEGQYLASIKLSDRYFGYQAVTDITYTNSRKQASSTLVLEMSNVSGTLSDAVKGMDLTHNGLWDLIQYLIAPGFAAKEIERSRNRTANWYKSIMLRTGARVHFRMGYSSNPMNMPTIMNGTITELQNMGEIVAAIIQDDGIELTNKIKAHPDETTRGFIISKKEPTQIVDELLRDDQGFLLNLKTAFDNSEYWKHSLGIMHFGFPGSPAASIFGEADRIMNEINMNVYETTGKLNSEKGFWGHLGDFFGIGDFDEPGININLYDKTVWDVLNIAASIGEDYVVAVHPFDFRSTIFSGKPYFPIAYGYHVDPETEKISLYRKPFRQFHVYDSVSSIIDNSIKTTESNMYTVAIGTFYNEGKLDTTEPIYVDTDIWPEKQKSVMIDTTLNAQGIRLVENIPLIGGWLNKPFKWYYDEALAIRIAAAGLRDYVKEMYDGYLTVVGDPAIKPYDQMLINDTFNNITGPAEAREVTHIMNLEFGFITMIKPDCVVVNSDNTSINFMQQCFSVGTALTVTLIMRHLLSNRGYAGTYPIMNAAWALTKRQFNKMIKKFKIDKGIETLKGYLSPSGSAGGAYQYEYDEVTGKRRRINPLSEETKQKWKISGLLDEIIKTLESFDLSKAEDLFDKADAILKDKRFLGYHKIDLEKIAKMRSVTSKLIYQGSKALKWTSSSARWAARGVGASSGIGIIPVLIETLVTEVVMAGVAEFIERWLFTRQACIIAPLRKDGYEFSAGINGHKGSVITDSPDVFQALFTNKFSAAFLSLLGADVSKYAANQAATDIFDIPTPGGGTIPIEGDGDSGIYTMAIEESEKDELPFDLKTVVTNFFMAHRKMVPYDEAFKAEYEKRILETQASWIEKEEKRMLENSRSPVYEVEFTTSSDDFARIDLNIPSGISAEAINKAFEGTGLAGLGAYFVQVETRIPESRNPKSGAVVGGAGVINGLYLAAHAAWETGWGSSKIFKDKNNLFGYGAYDSSAYESAWTFSSPQHCIYFAAQQIKKDYLTPGGKYYNGPTLVGMNVKYATDKNWANGIASIMRKIAQYDPSLRLNSNSRFSTSAEKPTVFGSEGRVKYRVQAAQASKVLIDMQKQPLNNVKLSLVSSSSLIRQATWEAVQRLADLYYMRTGDKITITSAYRPGDENWHGTGFAVDIDTPNYGRIAGEYRLPKGSVEKTKLETLVDLAVQVGFGGILLMDVDIIASIKRKYPNADVMSWPDHNNHLHLSYIR